MRKLITGDLDQEVTFQEHVNVGDGMGGRAGSLHSIATDPQDWANVLPLRGGEGFEDGRTNSASSYLFTVRNRQDIDETMVVVWRDEVYNIRNVRRNSTRDLFLVIEVERGVSS